MTKAVYIHIPFCNHICAYCDFPKMLYHQKWTKPYLESLKKEILTYYQKEKIATIYIGGGTPSALNLEEFQILLETVNIFKKKKEYEYTIECNIESLTEEKIKLMKLYGVNRVSIGVETMHPNHLKTINRNHTKKQVEIGISLLKQYGIKNINIDLMYALPNETLQDVKEDIQYFLSQKVPHISTYSLMIEPHTMLYYKKQKPINEELDATMYQTICKELQKAGYQHYEISNFSLPGYASKHNLTYWNNEHYYGFGLGASGYIDQIRYTNTQNLNHYCNEKYRFVEETMTTQITMENEMMLGLRKLEGVEESRFSKRYGKTITDTFSIQKLIQKGKLKQENGYIKIPEEYLYVSNDILLSFIGNTHDQK